MSKHTPGPWQIQDRPFTDCLHVGTDHKGFFTCAKVSGFDRVEINANARLIAAAPELLQEAKAIDCEIRALILEGKINGGHVMRWNALQAAIAKAEGNTK